MSVPFYHIFDKDSVGQLINPLPLNQILKWAGQATTAQTEENKPKILFLGIDIQTDFMDNGALGVAGAKQDVIRLSQFLYKHMDKLSKIIVSLDTHEVKQIFHPCWWVDIEGNQRRASADYGSAGTAEFRGAKIRRPFGIHSNFSFQSLILTLADIFQVLSFWYGSSFFI